MRVEKYPFVEDPLGRVSATHNHVKQKISHSTTPTRGRMISNSGENMEDPLIKWAPHTNGPTQTPNPKFETTN